MNRLYTSRFLILFLLMFPTAQQCYDNPHFYRATNFFPEPRLEKDWLFSFDATFGGGGTKHSTDAHRHTVPLLDTFGLTRAQDIGIGVPNKNLANNLDLILIELSRTPGRSTFGTFSVTGKFSILELNMQLYQNFCHGFFFNAHLPVRRFSTHDTAFVDLSPNDDIYPNKNTFIWQEFLVSFNAILQRYNLSANNVTQTGAGDLTMYLGWTSNYQESDVLDFIDFTFKAGVLAPTGKAKNEAELFSLPFGYNKHWGIPISAACSMGTCDWITIGGYGEVIFFFPRTRFIRLKTSSRQQGIIKLASGPVKVHEGLVWHAGGYFKADHVICGFSCGFGYSFASQHRTTLDTKSQLFPYALINDDESLHGFQMQVVHLFVEYDFATEDRLFGPRAGLFVNAQVSGKRTYKTSVGGVN
ncbi:MAG TPA: hypothetical protein VEK38_03115, partial [Candidatus Bathyarchaeia archaeon]|nr:hypothetical protein [Candidatus Bathyarchaeia archaeon]